MFAQLIAGIGDQVKEVGPWVLAAAIGFLGYVETRRMNNRQIHLDDEHLSEARAAQLIDGYKDLLPATMKSYEVRLGFMSQRVDELTEEIRQTKTRHEEELAIAYQHVATCETQLHEIRNRLRVAEARISELGG